MKIKQNARHLLEKMDYHINKFLGYTYWLHIGDLLTPCEGYMTAGQYLIASRILDVEELDKGRMPEWQNLLTDGIYGEKTIQDKEKANLKFKLLLESLDSRGLNPNIAKCSISDNPLVLNNGTHRIAWCALREPNIYLPCVLDRHDLKPWFPINGEQYFTGILNHEQLEALKCRYDKLLKGDIRTDLTACINKSKKAELSGLLNEYGEITGCSETVVDNNILEVFRFRLKKQFLFTKGNRVFSKYVCKIEDKLKGSVRLGHTVTESMEIENWIEEKSGSRIF